MGEHTLLKKPEGKPQEPKETKSCKENTLAGAWTLVQCQGLVLYLVFS